MAQNLSTNFNTINNNVFNNINNLGTIETNPLMTTDPSPMNRMPENSQMEEEKIYGADEPLLHPKPPLDDAEVQPQKHVHREEDPQNPK